MCATIPVGENHHESYCLRGAVKMQAVRPMNREHQKCMDLYVDDKDTTMLWVLGLNPGTKPMRVKISGLLGLSLKDPGSKSLSC